MLHIALTLPQQVVEVVRVLLAQHRVALVVEGVQLQAARVVILEEWMVVLRRVVATLALRAAALAVTAVAVPKVRHHHERVDTMMPGNAGVIVAMAVLVKSVI